MKVIFVAAFLLTILQVMALTMTLLMKKVGCVTAFLLL